MSSKFLDKDIYKIVKERADQIYKKPSAYKSGWIVKEYKRLKGRFLDSDEKPLKRWFREEWKDYAPLIGEKSKYPVYRPTKRISKDTPSTVHEIPKKRLKEQYKLKQEIKGKKNLPKF